MEITRELYWNIGAGREVLSLVYAITAAGVGVALFGLWSRIRVYRTGQPLQRCDDIGRRVWRALGEVFLQYKVRCGAEAGRAHSLFFWSFFLLVAGTFLIFIQADIATPLFHKMFLQGRFYLAFSLVLDVAGIMAVIMLVRLAVIRYRGREDRRFGPEKALLYGLLLFTLCSGFAVEGVRIAATELGPNPELARWSPIGLVIAQLFSFLDDTTLRSIHLILWWIHLCAATTCIIIVPFTRLRHMVTTSASCFFAPLDSHGRLTDLDLQPGRRHEYGAATARGLSWKDLLDSDACTDCSRCQDQCPAWLSQKPLSPMKLVSTVQESAFGEPGSSIVEKVTTGAIWSCTTCRGCEAVCPASVEHVGKIVEMRRHLVLMEGACPDEGIRMFRNLEVLGDPMGMGQARRIEWAEGLGLEDAVASAADTIVWVGCAGAFDERYRRVVRSFFEILRSGGENFAILGESEVCCGDFARRMGNEYLYQALAMKNIELFTRRNIRKVITTCPHCFNVFRNEYPALGCNVEVIHHSRYLHGLLREGKVRVTRPLEHSVTYHDSCYLGRYNQMYGEPREVLQQISGIRLVEPDRSRERSFCCGGGGGFVWMSEQGKRINEIRAGELAALQPGIIATACPYCLYMLEEGVAANADEAGTVETLDLAEIVARSL